MNQNQEIVEVCRRLHARGWLAAADGNVSVREPSNSEKIWITPSGQAKAFMNPDDMAAVSLSGNTLLGKPSSESAMHLAIYRHAPKAMAVVHAHPPVSIAWTIAHPELNELPAQHCSELVLAMGSVPFVPYARPGTEDMGKALTAFLPRSRVMILKNHGAITWGESLQEAYLGMERLEHSATLLMHAITLAQGKPLAKLPDAEFQILVKMREQLGDKIL